LPCARMNMGRVDTERIMTIVAGIKPTGHVHTMPVFPCAAVCSIGAFVLGHCAVAIVPHESLPWPAAVRAVQPMHADGNLLPKFRGLFGTLHNCMTYSRAIFDSFRLTGAVIVDKKLTMTLKTRTQKTFARHERTPYKREVVRLAV
jgi:hypothetical protein